MRLDLRQSGPWIGVAGLVVVLWFYLASRLVAPWWAVGVLLAAWVVMLGLSIAWARRRPFVVLVMPLIALALWVGVLSAGAALLGWTA